VDRRRFVSNPHLILATLDANLERPTRVILYGRAALALGFPGADAALAATMDVDAILPMVEMAAIKADTQFWHALERCNRELEPRGLYMTHLFPDDQVILTPDWLDRIVPLPAMGWRRLRPYRPAVLDLILTKMMREDPQDLGDIEFLLRQEPLGFAELQAAWAAARVPEIDEIRAAFAANRARVTRMVTKA
jgi:hypothetical protein